MDAKPQRPRALRVRDENIMPLSANATKFLHQRTKSTPSMPNLRAGEAKQPKQALGLKDKNMGIKTSIMKDDSGLGLASPDKLKAEKKVSEVLAAVNAKSEPFPFPKLRSTATASDLRSGLSTATSLKQLQPEKSKAVPSAQINPVPKSAEIPVSITVERQEVRTTEMVPLRDEPMARVLTQSQAQNTQRPQANPALILDNDIAALGSEFQENVEPQSDGGVPLADDLPADDGFVHAGLFSSTSVHAAPVNGGPVLSGPVVIPHADAMFLPEPVADLLPEEDEDYTAARSWGLPTDATLTTLFDPKYTEKILTEIEAARVYVENNRTSEDIEDELWDSSMVAEYSDEIFDYFRELELSMKPDPFYMANQTELGWSMRAVLIDWVVQVHARFNLLPETLFLTVNYIDRFLTNKVVSLGKLQLVGATAIFLAAKYEEVNCPTLSEIVYMVENGYSGDEILKAERFMLTLLEFRLGWPGPMSFLRRISKADDYDLETRTLAKYFLEVTIMDERFLGLTPSFLAAGAHCMARLMLRKGEWTQAHVFYSNYTFSQLKSLLRGILECLEVPRRHHQSVFVKYTDRRFKRASTFVETEMANGFRLPFMRAY